MMLWCLVFVGLAVMLGTGAAPAQRIRTRLAEVGSEPIRPATGGRRGWLSCVTLGALLLGVGLAHRLGGAPAVAVSVAVAIVAASSARIALQERSARRAARAQVEVAHACSMLASQVRVGRVPAEALTSAAQDSPVLAEAKRTLELGGEVTEVWWAQSTRRGHGGLRDLAMAWRVSAQTGAPLADGLDQVSEALSADVALRAVIAGELSAPRATGKVMAVLPFCGLGMGYLLGGDPLHFLWSSSYGWACLVVGVALAAAGVLWIDRLSRLATEQS